MNEKSLESRVILVTGAGSGLGREAAKAYAAQGATVILLGRNEAWLDAVYDEIMLANHPRPAIIPFDLAQGDDAAFENLAATIQHELNHLDGILHSANHFLPLSPLSTQRLKTWQPALATNLLAPFALTRALLPLLERSPDASVLFTVEEHGLDPAAYWGGFAVSHAALAALAKIFADEYRTHDNLRFNVLVPGSVRSPMRSRTHPGVVPESLRDPKELMADYCYWMGPGSRGHSGKIIRLTGQPLPPGQSP